MTLKRISVACLYYHVLLYLPIFCETLSWQNRELAQFCSILISCIFFQVTSESVVFKMIVVTNEAIEIETENLDPKT